MAERDKVNLCILSPTQELLQKVMLEAPAKKNLDVWTADFIIDGKFPPRERKRAAPEKRADIEKYCSEHDIHKIKLILDFFHPSQFFVPFREYPEDMISREEKDTRRLVQSRHIYEWHISPHFRSDIIGRYTQNRAQRSLKCFRESWLNMFLESGYQINEGVIWYDNNLPIRDEERKTLDIEFTQDEIRLRGDLEDKYVVRWFKKLKSQV